VGEVCLAVGHDPGIDVVRAGAVAAFAADTLLGAEGLREERILVLGAGDVAESAALVGRRVLEILVLGTEAAEEQSPVGGEPPVGVTVPALKPLHVLRSPVGTAVTVHARP
jgi:hypothetical protein